MTWTFSHRFVHGAYHGPGMRRSGVKMAFRASLRVLEYRLERLGGSALLTSAIRNKSQTIRRAAHMRSGDIGALLSMADGRWLVICPSAFTVYRCEVKPAVSSGDDLTVKSLCFGQYQ